MENAIAISERYDMTQDAMTPATVVNQVQLIQQVMEKVMKDGEHYGVIPGCGKKPSLLKAGAEKLSLTFRLAPSYTIIQTDGINGHREYYVKCSLTHIPTGKTFGEGVGACSTMEGKYRFRTGEVEFTDKEVPKAYWTERDQKLIGGKGFSTKKNDSGKWMIVRAGEKVEHDNPADYYNTVLKMAKKRAHVDAVLTATAASDIFTQDVEDMPEVINVKKEQPAPAKESACEDAQYTPDTSPQRYEDEPPQEEHNVDDIVIARIEDIKEVHSKPDAARKWTAWFIKSATGSEFGTFDSKISNLAHEYWTSGELVAIKWKPGKKEGTKEIIELGLAA